VAASSADSRAEEAAQRVNPQGTVLITGGLGGLGGLMARHLVTEYGIRYILLASRSGLDAHSAPKLKAELEELGGQVTVAACDVTDREQLKQLLDSISDEHPLSAVLHAAGTADNAMVDSLTPEKIDRVLAPKLDGAVYLHELTEHFDVDAFVLFSSMAGVFGGPGQGNYAAGNVFLDALAAHRRSQGLVATSIAWPLWTDVGMGRYLDAAAMRRMAGSSSLSPLSPTQGLELFDRALIDGDGAVIPAHLDSRVVRAEAKAGVLPTLLCDLAPRSLRRVHEVVSSESLARLLATTPESDRERVVLDLVRAQVAAVLGHASPEAIDSQRALLELGFDSLAAVELRNSLSKATGLRLPPTLVFDYPTSAMLADYLSSEIVASSSSSDSGSTEMMTSLFEHARSLEMMDEFRELLVMASRFRPSFAAPLEPAVAPRSVQLSRGAALPGLVCLPSVIAMSGPHDFVGFAKSFRDTRDVLVIPNPGFASNERLPASLSVAVETQAQAIQRCFDSTQVALIGYSTGGILAYAIASHLKHTGSPPAAVILIDTYVLNHAKLGELTDAILGQNQMAADLPDSRLTAMGGYGRCLAEWEPRELNIPTLLVRATEPVVGLSATGEWRSTWAFTHTAVDAAGDHVTLMGEYSESTAQAVEKWLATTVCP
jgi:NAD(P)-dependent dehydrogenase (short-subunit alcohol dehydrogenase family)/acyl carrier protein